MEVLTAPEHVAAWSAQARWSGHRVGFVPTMGALHTGHASLISQALRQCERVVVSIFVNPLQFNDLNDLARYPRSPDADRALLEELGCHALFLPDEHELYQGHRPMTFDLGGLDTYWEGPDRPGHFQGVVNAVERLFLYVRPDKAFFGEKDRQQLAIVRHVATTLQWPEQIVGCPIHREPDGLAMSSRNVRLSPSDRERAPLLYEALLSTAQSATTGSPAQAQQAGLAVLARDPEIVVDYLGIADAVTLEPLDSWRTGREAVALLAARLGEVRLIDNILLHPSV
ncbi:MAG: pantoate--beta-alanine ligase [Flavobacteriales bacterium]|nr:pantoate--beta-alanine ligase [Flavobacteriales bacterium]